MSACPSLHFESFDLSLTYWVRSTPICISVKESKSNNYEIIHMLIQLLQISTAIKFCIRKSFIISC